MITYPTQVLDKAFMKTGSTPLILILLGPPGSGKGTQAAILKKKLGIAHVSTGEILRDHIRKETPLGKQAALFMNQGQLVPDSLILDMLFKRIALPDCEKGYILDGFPRTIPQAEALQAHLMGEPKPFVCNLNLSDAKIVERLTQRLTCSHCQALYHLTYSPPKKAGICDLCGHPLIQRPDDVKEVVLHRLHVYREQTEPLIHYYENLQWLHTIDCDRPPEEVFEEILTLFRTQGEFSL